MENKRQRGRIRCEQGKKFECDKEGMDEEEERLGREGDNSYKS